MRRLTKVEIIDETAEYYNKYPERRGVGSSSPYDPCVYQAKNDPLRQCDVGRCLLAPARKQLTGRSTPVNCLGHEFFNKSLKAKYRGHSLNFWVGLQMLHDDVNCWCSAGITEHGKNQVKQLKGLYCATND